MKIEGGQIAERPSFDLAEIQQIGAIFVKSGFFKDTKDASQAIVKVMAGAEMGFGPMASMGGIYIVKGKVSISANLMAAAVKRSRRYDYKIRAHNAEVCRIEFFDGKESLGVSEFTMKEAVAGKLHQDYDQDTKQWKDKATWKNFPKNMLFARAISNGVKWYCPEITSGPVYTPDELGVDENQEGEPIITTPAPAPRKERNITPVPTPAAEVVENSSLGLSGALRAWAVKTKGARAGNAYYDGYISKMSAKDQEMFASENCVKWNEAEGDRAAQAVIDAEVITETEADDSTTDILDAIHAEIGVCQTLGVADGDIQTIIGPLPLEQQDNTALATVLMTLQQVHDTAKKAQKE